MRTIRKTFANLSKSTIFLGKAGENLVTRLEIDVSKELSEYASPSFDLILSMPSESEPYPVLANLSGSNLIYTFTENDLSKAGNGLIEALVAGSNGEVLKSTTAKTVIEPSINQNTYPGPIQRFLEQLENNVRNIVMQYNIEVVDALPATARTGKIVYLIGSGFYYYSDGQWNIISSGGSNEIIVARVLSDLEDVDDGKIVFIPESIEESGETFVAGWYKKDEQEFVPISELLTGEEKAEYNDAVQKKHTHSNKAVLDKIGEENGQMTYNGDNISPLSLGVTYDALSVRPDWQDVPVYITGSNPVVCRLASDADIGGFAESEIRLMYLADYQTGMPCPVLAVTSAGNYCVYFPVTFHDMGVTLSPGWYDVNNNPLFETPTFTDMTFDKLFVGSGEAITDLTGLSGEALCALETLSRMVNVSVDAMGGLGVKPDGVQRLTNAPIPGRRYAAVTSRNMTFPLPPITWTGEEREFWVDLDCESSISLTFSDEVCYEDGGNVDTTRGKHRLHFYAPAGADMWTVAETESVAEITEDIVPEYAIPFRNCTADQLRAVLKYGYSNNDDAWCVRKNGIDIEFFHVGDMRSVTLTNGQEVTMRIIGIHHDDLPNGGKAALTCDFAELISVSSFRVGQNSLYDTWSTRNVAKSVANLLPMWLYDLTACAKKPCCQVKNTDNSYITHTEITTDKTWLLSLSEVALAPSSLAHDGTPYALFTDNASRMRYDGGNRDRWLLRTGRSDSRYNLTVTSDGALMSGSGNTSGTTYDTYLTTVAVGFCLNVD